MTPIYLVRPQGPAQEEIEPGVICSVYEESDKVAIKNYLPYEPKLDPTVNDIEMLLWQDYRGDNWIKPADLLATQDWVYLPHLEDLRTVKHFDEPIQVAKIGGKYAILDGHHRACTAILEMEREVWVEVIGEYLPAEVDMACAPDVATSTWYHGSYDEGWMTTDVYIHAGTLQAARDRVNFNNWDLQEFPERRSYTIWEFTLDDYTSVDPLLYNDWDQSDRIVVGEFGKETEHRKRGEYSAYAYENHYEDRYSVSILVDPARILHCKVVEQKDAGYSERELLYTDTEKSLA